MSRKLQQRDTKMIDSMKDTLANSTTDRSTKKNSTLRRNLLNNNATAIGAKLKNFKNDLRRVFSSSRFSFRNKNKTQFTQDDIDKSLKNVLEDPDTLLNGCKIEEDFDYCFIRKTQRVDTPENIEVNAVKTSEIIEDMQDDIAYSNVEIAEVSRQLSDISIKLPDDQKKFQPDQKFFKYVKSDVFLGQGCSNHIHCLCCDNKKSEASVSSESNEGQSLKMKGLKKYKNSRYNPISKQFKISDIKKRTSNASSMSWS